MARAYPSRADGPRNVPVGHAGVTVMSPEGSPRTPSPPSRCTDRRPDTST
jgi:hypothetical protein